jgi:hypothetical protein
MIGLRPAANHDILTASSQTAVSYSGEGVKAKASNSG